jgi:tRNA threonylcarbamoyladenosine biosynthesis protein TsaE
MGYEEYFYSGNYCFTEWSEKIEPLLPQSYIRIDIQEINNGVRKFVATRIE